MFMFFRASAAVAASASKGSGGGGAEAGQITVARFDPLLGKAELQYASGDVADISAVSGDGEGEDVNNGLGKIDLSTPYSSPPYTALPQR